MANAAMNSFKGKARGTRWFIAPLAAGFMLAGAPGAQAAEEEVLGLLDSSIAIQVEQYGEQSCFLRESYVEQMATDAIKEYCDLDIVPANQTDSRNTIIMNWGLARSYSIAGSTRVNLCYSPFISSFGRNADARLIEESAGNLRVFALALSVSEAFVHQRTNQTRNVIYDGLAERFTIYAKDLCG